MKNKILIICIITILLTTYVSAFGISTFYWKERPLIMNPGETREIKFSLQNEPMGNHITLKGELSTGFDIAELTGNTVFSLKPGQTGVPVYVKISIPETAKIGEEYEVGVTFTTAMNPRGNMLEMGTQIGKSIPVVVGKVIEPKKTIFDIIPKENISGIAILLVLIALVVFLVRKKKKK